MQGSNESWQSCFVFLVGPSGSGKTVVATRLAGLMHWPAIDTDALIESREQRTISDIFDNEGEAHFRRLESAAIDDILSEGNEGVVATGGGLPTIEGMMERLRAAGKTIYLKASLDELWNRLTVDRYELEKRPLLRKRGRAGLQDLLRRREGVYNLASITLLTDGMTVDAIAKKTQAAIQDAPVLG